MTYQFYCDACKKDFDVDIPIAEYDVEKTNQTCPICKGPIRRVIIWNGPASINGGYEAEAGRAKWQ